ncbi:MAG: Gfo/Idh/MocA family oxidoreductase [Candidatus Latescibacterota bacterium]|jgi:hypothetical protein
MSLRGGLVGCGYFAQNHLNAWREVQGAEIVAICDTNMERAQRCVVDFEVAGVYDDLGEMLAGGALDFVDIVTQPAQPSGTGRAGRSSRYAAYLPETIGPVFRKTHARWSRLVRAPGCLLWCTKIFAGRRQCAH